VLRTRHGASQPVTPSAAYASEAEPPLLHITTLTTDNNSPNVTTPPMQLSVNRIGGVVVLSQHNNFNVVLLIG